MRAIFEVMGHAVEFFPGKQRRLEIEYPGPKSIAEILQYINVKDALVMYAMSSGVRRSKDYIPKDGEELILFTPPAGG